MKKLIVFLLVTVLLAGCAEKPIETTAPTEPVPTTVPETTEPVEKAPVFYFSNALEMDRLYSMRTDGTDLTLVLDAQCWNVTHADDTVYFTSMDCLYAYRIPTGEQKLLAKGVMDYVLDGNDLVYSAEYYGQPLMHLRHIDLTTLEDTLLLSTGYTAFTLCDGNLYYTDYTEDFTQLLMLYQLRTGQTKTLCDKADSYYLLHAAPGGVYCNVNFDYWAFISTDGDFRRDDRIPNTGSLLHVDENGVFCAEYFSEDYSLYYVDNSGTETDILRRTDLSGCLLMPLPEGNWLLQFNTPTPWGPELVYGYPEHYAYRVDYSILDSQWNLKTLDCAGVAGNMFRDGDFPVLDSSTARKPVTTALCNLFVKNYGYEGTEPLCSTTHGAWLNIADGKADLAFLAAPTPEEEAYLKEKGVEVEMKLYGGDGLVFIGHQDNPVTNLTHEQIIGIYQGRITNWKEVGGPDHPIHVYFRDDQSGSQRLFEKLVFKGLEIPDFYALGFPEIDTMSSIVGEIMLDPYAIGYSIMTYLSEVYENEALKVFSVNGIVPSPETVKDRTYPYNTQGYLVIRSDEPADSPARRLFDWFGCPMSDEILIQSEVTPLRDDTK